MIGVTYTYTENIGDEFQIIGLLQLLNSLGVAPEFTLNRDTLDCPWTIAPKNGKLIINGWLAERRSVVKSLFPQIHRNYLARTNREGRTFMDPKNLLKNNIKTLFIGIHINQDLYEDLKEFKDFREFWRDCGPIGTRDLNSKKLLEELGIEAYFSGCLTLNIRYEKERDRKVAYEVDVPYDKLTKYEEKFESFGQIIKDNTPESLERIIRRHNFAKARLYRIANAKRIISDRLHVYLPSLSLGTPFEFADIEFAKNDPRFTGLLDLNQKKIEEIRKIQKSRIIEFIEG